MIVVDSSALIAILQYEPERAVLYEAIAKADRRLVSAITYQETSQVIFSRLGARPPDARRAADDVSCGDRPSRRAAGSSRRRCVSSLRQGVHPKARLNFGDCAVYALSRQTGAPLLFKGNDFAATDVAACLAPEAP